MEKGRGIMYRVQYQPFFSFPAIPHKPVLLHQKCPDGDYAVRQVRLYTITYAGSISFKGMKVLGSYAYGQSRHEALARI